VAMTPVVFPVLSLVNTVGAMVGLAVLLGVGSAEGKIVGSADGGVVGTCEGCGLPPKNVGFRVIDGKAEGAGLGGVVGTCEGCDDGSEVGME
jgi:hypothetical protein